MRQRIWQLLGIVVASGVVIGPRWVPAVSAQAPNPDVLSALLVEVRGLRASMEQMASAGPRIQLATARLQLQEQRINALVRRLEGLRQNLAVVESETADKQDRLARMEEALKQADQPGREEITQEVALLRRDIAAAPAQVQRLQAEEAQASQELAMEQGRWSEINQRLDELDRALTRRER
jgi:chromosome segregation ATPase